MRTYYLVRPPAVVAFSNIPTGVEFPKIAWDFFMDDMERRPIFSDDGFLRSLNGPGDPVYDVAEMLAAKTS